VNAPHGENRSARVRDIKAPMLRAATQNAFPSSRATLPHKHGKRLRRFDPPKA
jgi:hypothetical protein